MDCADLYNLPSTNPIKLKEREKMEKKVLKGIYFSLRDQKISSMLFSCFALSFQTLDNSHACIVFAALAEKQSMRLQHMAALAHMKLYSQ